MLKIEIHELATKELDEAVLWYDLQSDGLGSQFQRTLIDQLELVRVNPSWYLKEDEVFYKVYVPKFPYKLLYTYDDERVIVWVIAHMNREPRYWQSRIK